MTENHAWGRGFAVGVLFGLAGGAALGVLYAPKKGKKTRHEIVRQAERLGERGSDMLASAEEILEAGRRTISR